MRSNVIKNILWFIFVILFFPVMINFIQKMPTSLNALNQAIKDDDIQKVKKIIEDDPGVMNRKVFATSSPFSTAIYCCNADMANILIEHGFDINQPIGRQDDSPLMIAIRHDCMPIIRLLLKNGADTNAENITGATPLSKAIEYDSLQIVKLLMEKGANIHYYRVKKNAVEYKRTEILDFLIKSGLDGDHNTLLKL